MLKAVSFLSWPSIRVCAALLCATLPLAAHDIITTKLTYTRDISRIFVRRCASCHQASASIPLTSYEQVRPWAVDIKEQVLSRAMPPWGAVKGFGDFAADAGLTQEEILIVSAWVVGGAPEGDPSMLPKAAPAAELQRPPLAAGLQVETRATLRRATVISGIRPEGAGLIPSSRIIARWPDGRIEPLVWLYQYDGRRPHTFYFRHSVTVPPGTVIEASAPLTFTLEKPLQSAFTGTVKTTVLTTP